MEAIFEHGGITEAWKLTPTNFNALNMILNAISESDSSEELMANLDRTRHKFLRGNLKYSFSHYLTSGGVEIYIEGQKERLIFVPCETDIEI